jgi:N-methylhydantoinase B
MRARIAAIADGEYRVAAWNEWEDELYRVPCTLTIDGDNFVFDFEGASPQAPHYFNSQPYIVKSALMMVLRPLLALDLPFTGGLVAPIEVRCPEGSIVHARPPAPINNGHVHVAMTAAEAAMQCVRLALWATHPAVPASRFVSAGGGSSAMATTTWSAVDSDGPTAWALLDGGAVGGPGTIDHDGADASSTPVGFPSPATAADVEVMEAWYPILVTERGLRAGVHGAGASRSGAGGVFTMEPYGTERFVGQMLGIRQWTPLPGMAGGSPGSTAEFLIRRTDGTYDRVSAMAANVVVEAGESFELHCPTSGGLGDPLDREPARVANDLAEEWVTASDAEAVYGVVLDAEGGVDAAATEAARTALRTARLGRARSPRRPLTDDDVEGRADGDTVPLSPGIVQRGAVAFAEVSGTPLAIAPHAWTDGCAVTEEPLAGPGPDLVRREYLDPRTGRALHVEVVPVGEPVSFTVAPRRWTERGS